MKEIAMQFWDFGFNLMRNGNIEFDEALQPEQLNLEEGEVFEVRIINNKIVLEKRNGS